MQIYKQGICAFVPENNVWSSIVDLQIENVHSRIVDALQTESTCVKQVDSIGTLCDTSDNQPFASSSLVNRKVNTARISAAERKPAPSRNT